jgi:hypothetical protein
VTKLCPAAPPADRKRARLLALVCLALAACSPAPAPTFFVPPTQFTQILPTQPVVRVVTATTVITPTASVTPPPPCTSGLTYVQDLTVPDDTAFGPGQSIDKQWLVTNSGTCDWNSSYRLKLIDGPAMGAVTSQALYPARAGVQATIQIIFSAPADSGTYKSTWQAFDPQGAAFGDPFYIQIVVQ